MTHVIIRVGGRRGLGPAHKRSLSAIPALNKSETPSDSMVCTRRKKIASVLRESRWPARDSALTPHWATNWLWACHPPPTFSREHGAAGSSEVYSSKSASTADSDRTPSEPSLEFWRRPRKKSGARVDAPRPRTIHVSRERESLPVGLRIYCVRLGCTASEEYHDWLV